jgi:hypothetical protein
MQGIDITKNSKQFTREFSDREGIKIVWYYDVDKYGMNPFKTEIIHPEGINDNMDDETDNENLPKTKRKYFNPTNNKYVGYTRAKMLGLID